MNDDRNDWFKRQLIARAQRGDAEAGSEILREIALAIDAGGFDPILFPFHAECLWLFMQGAPLDKALCVKADDRGGRPLKYDELALAAVDFLLRDHAKHSAEQANRWIEDRIGADRTIVQRARKAHKPMEAARIARIKQQIEDTTSDNREKKAKEADRDLLLHLSGSLRSKVAEAIFEVE